MATETKCAERYDSANLESLICDVRDMSGLCTIALEAAVGGVHVGDLEIKYVKVPEENWQALSFAIHQQDTLIRRLVANFYADEVEPAEV
jgi:hypothetical protein